MIANSNSFTKERQIDKLKSMIDQDTAMYVIFVPSDGLVTCNNGKLKFYKNSAINYNKNLKSIVVFVGFQEKETDLIESIKQQFSDDFFISDFDQSIMNYFGIRIIPSILNVSNKSKNYKITQEDIGINFELVVAKIPKSEIDFIDETFKLTKIGNFIKDDDKYYIIDGNIHTCLVLDKSKNILKEKIKYDGKYYKSIEIKENQKNEIDTNINISLNEYIKNKIHIESFKHLSKIYDKIYVETDIVEGMNIILNEDSSKSYNLAYQNALVNIDNSEITYLDLDSKFTYDKKFKISEYWVTEIADLNYKRDSLQLFKNINGSLKPFKKYAIDDSIKKLNFNYYFNSNEYNYCITLHDTKLFKLDNNFEVNEDLSYLFTELNNKYKKENLKPNYINYIENNGNLYILVEIRSKESANYSYQLIEINLENKSTTIVLKKVYALDYNIEDIKLFDVITANKFEFLIKLEDTRWILYRQWQ